MKMRLTPILVLLAVAAFVAAPFVTPPFMGYAPGQFPVEIARPSIQPAGYAFSIWGLIYGWLAVHAIYGLLIRAEDTKWDATRLPLIGALVLGSVWLAIAGLAPITATVTIWAMLGLALIAYLRADPRHDRWLMSAPLSIFAGWLTAAAAVSLGVVLGGYGVLGDTASALAMLTLVLIVALSVQKARPTMPLYPATILWALFGIIFVNWTANPTVAFAAIGGGLIMAIAAALLTRR